MEPAMAGELNACNGTYQRRPDGRWCYRWGAEVPGARDLTMADVLPLQAGDVPGARPLTAEEFRWATGQIGAGEGVLVRRPERRRPDVRDIVVGIFAPELHVLAMLTLDEVAKLAGVSKATIDSYRYRGYLPEPQAVLGRTPMWTRPVVNHWIETRPGCGWRTDLYGQTANA
jgi:predicted DNA-binding transcriptional regulator AlpA